VTVRSGTDEKRSASPLRPGLDSNPTKSAVAVASGRGLALQTSDSLASSNVR